MLQNHPDAHRMGEHTSVDHAQDKKLGCLHQSLDCQKTKHVNVSDLR
jgi:hypothetical protein